MRTTLFSTLIALIGFNSQAAVIEGHFYGNTCGDNITVTTIQPITQRILIRNTPTLVQKVCHGSVLHDGQYVEIIRLYLANSSEDAQFVDFQVKTKFIESTNDRSLLRKAIIFAQNDQMGEVEFMATTNFMSQEIVALQTQGSMNGSALSFVSPDMEKVLNITSVESEKALQ